MAAVLWSLLGVMGTILAMRLSGGAGRERLEATSDLRLRALHDNYESRLPSFLIVGGIGLSVLGLGLSAVAGLPLGIVLWAVAAAALTTSLIARRRARPNVLSTFASRRLEPLTTRIHSETRERRENLLGVIALSAFVLGEVCSFFADRDGIEVLTVVAALALVVGLIAVLALLWTTAWVFGDERER